MQILLAFAVGALYAAAIYMMLRRSVVKEIIGLALMSNATNLLILTAGGLTRGRPPIVPDGAAAVPAPYADPLPQALVLTAIVISFAVLSFAVVLIYRAVESLGTDDLDDLRSTDQ